MVEYFNSWFSSSTQQSLKKMMALKTRSCFLSCVCFLTVSNTDFLSVMKNILVLSNNSFGQSGIELCACCMYENVRTSLKVDADGIKPLSPAGVAR